jgi:hypothetical protein
MKHPKLTAELQQLAVDFVEVATPAEIKNLRNILRSAAIARRRMKGSTLFSAFVSEFKDLVEFKPKRKKVA